MTGAEQTHVPCWQGDPLLVGVAAQVRGHRVWISAIRFICCLMHGKTLTPTSVPVSMQAWRCICAHVRPCMPCLTRYSRYVRGAKVGFTWWFYAPVSLWMWTLSSDLQSLAGMQMYVGGIISLTLWWIQELIRSVFFHASTFISVLLTEPKTLSEIPLTCVHPLFILPLSLSPSLDPSSSCLPVNPGYCIHLLASRSNPSPNTAWFPCACASLSRSSHSPLRFSWFPVFILCNCCISSLHAQTAMWARNSSFYIIAANLNMQTSSHLPPAAHTHTHTPFWLHKHKTVLSSALPCTPCPSPCMSPSERRKKEMQKRQETFLLSSTIPDEIQKSLFWRKRGQK